MKRSESKIKRFTSFCGNKNILKNT